MRSAPFTEWDAAITATTTTAAAAARQQRERRGPPSSSHSLSPSYTHTHTNVKHTHTHRSKPPEAGGGRRNSFRPSPPVCRQMTLPGHPHSGQAMLQQRLQRHLVAAEDSASARFLVRYSDCVCVCVCSFTEPDERHGNALGWRAACPAEHTVLRRLLKCSSMRRRRQQRTFAWCLDPRLPLRTSTTPCRAETRNDVPPKCRSPPDGLRSAAQPSTPTQTRRRGNLH